MARSRSLRVCHLIDDLVHVGIVKMVDESLLDRIEDSFYAISKRPLAMVDDTIAASVHRQIRERIER